MLRANVLRTKPSPPAHQPSHIFQTTASGWRLTLEELLDVLGLAGEREAAQLDERVLLDEVLALQAHLELLGLCVEDWKEKRGMW